MPYIRLTKTDDLKNTRKKRKKVFVKSDKSDKSISSYKTQIPPPVLFSFRTKKPFISHSTLNLVKKKSS